VSPSKFLHIKLPVHAPDDTNHAWLGHENVFLQRPLLHFTREKSNSPASSCFNGSGAFLRNKYRFTPRGRNTAQLTNALNSRGGSVSTGVLKQQKKEAALSQTLRGIRGITPMRAEGRTHCKNTNRGRCQRRNRSREARPRQLYPRWATAPSSGRLSAWARCSLNTGQKEL